VGTKKCALLLSSDKLPFSESKNHQNNEINADVEILPVSRYQKKHESIVQECLDRINNFMEATNYKLSFVQHVRYIKTATFYFMGRSILVPNKNNHENSLMLM